MRAKLQGNDGLASANAVHRAGRRGQDVRCRLVDHCYNAISNRRPPLHHFEYLSDTQAWKYLARRAQLEVDLFRLSQVDFNALAVTFGRIGAKLCSPPKSLTIECQIWSIVLQ